MDKVELIRQEIERLKESGCASPIVICDTLLSFIDSLQEEPMKIRKGCKYRCKNDMRNNDTGKISFIGGKIYYAPEDDMLVSEEDGWRCDTSEDASNFELVEEPVSDDLDIAIGEYCSNPDNFITYIDVAFAYRSEQKDDIPLIIKAIKFGANWQKAQLLQDAIGSKVIIDAGGYPCVACVIELYDYDKDVPLAKKGDKVKIVVIKEEE